MNNSETSDATQGTTLTLAMCQLSSSPSPEENRDTIAQTLAQAGQQHAELAILPEYCLCQAALNNVISNARTHEQWLDYIGPIAKQAGMATVFGGLPTLLSDGTTVNRSFAVGADGIFLVSYDKRRLFPLKPHGSPAESELFMAGNTPASFMLKGFKIGLTTCFDLRFPELFADYSDCHLIICTAAFTESTGREHWYTLLRARAIERQAWLAGVNQCGANRETDLRLFGHTTLYDPWGLLTATAPHSDPALVIASISAERVCIVRNLLPMMKGSSPNAIQ